MTIDASKFLPVSPAGCNQVYTDGGLLLMMALEYEGLASCLLNTMLPVKREKAIRKIIDLLKN